MAVTVETVTNEVPTPLYVGVKVQSVVMTMVVKAAPWSSVTV